MPTHIAQRGADVFNSFYKIPTPANATLRAGFAEMWRYRTRPICAKCGMAFPKNIYFESPKMEQNPYNIAVLRAAPSVYDETVMEFFMMRACNEGVGCWKDCSCGKNWNMRCINNCVALGRLDASGFGKARPGDCGCLCTCTPGCGNRKRYPCDCGHRLEYHMRDCPVGLFKRDSSFLLPWKRRKMVEAGQKRMRRLA